MALDCGRSFLRLVQQTLLTSQADQRELVNVLGWPDINTFNRIYLMIRCKFVLRVFRNNEVVVEHHETGEYEFDDAVVLAHSVARFLQPSCRRSVHHASYPATVNIDMPSIDGGYNNDVTVDIIKVIEVKTAVAVADGDDDDQEFLG